MSANGFTAADLDRYRAVQQLAYQCVEEIGATLEPGVTEKQVAKKMRHWLMYHGVEEWFHIPFAWFGDRTAFRGKWNILKFFPTDRRLEEGMPYILDVAPVRGGAMADIGYANSLGPNPDLDSVLDDLAAHRALILDLVRERRPMAEIYHEVDGLAAKQGYDNRHQAYPGRVLAHPAWSFRPGRSLPAVGGFGLRTLATLGRSLVVNLPRGASPLWNGGRFSQHPPTPGLWAIEPHLGSGDVGAKFEELMVVTPDDAYWLDDDLPHVRRWAARQS
jgi:Xaa-Pro aminopeptidase